MFLPQSDSRNLYISPNIIRIIKYIWEIYSEKLKGRELGRPRRRGGDNSRMVLREIRCEVWNRFLLRIRTSGGPL
jgi:hypothetical protein